MQTNVLLSAHAAKDMRISIFLFYIANLASFRVKYRKGRNIH